jgi:GH15 family glucan-1,4-alpha-glucosidase
MAERGYRPISDYAAIGDCHGGALVASDGGIDWCALGRFDADPVCCRLLDAGRGSHLSVQPQGQYTSSRAYVADTNLLHTELAGAGGRLALTDFMPVGRTPEAGANDYVSLNAPGWLVRRLECLEGAVDCEILYQPGGLLPQSGPQAMLHTDLPLGRTLLRPGKRHYLVLAPAGTPGIEPALLDRLERITTAFWREWIGYCRHRGPYADMVRRSALALKLMTYAPTGASVAAFTTSLPEEIGGARNWDYRYCWVRDASLMLHALAALGYSGESRRFLDFLRGVLGDPIESLQVMYGIHMEKKLDERTLGHLEGYRGSRPVRLGNAAYRQRQTDLYGYVLEAALVFQCLGGRITDEDRRAFGRIVEFIAGCWEEPDLGLWEMRGAPRHFVHSKASCWVVVDRAIRLCGAQPGWSELRERMARELLARGRARAGHFVQAFDDPPERLDAALLHLPMLAVPADAETFRRTREAVEGALRRGDLVHRYRGEDGLGGGADEAFLPCSFWLVEALLAEERKDEAGALFERLLALANDVGLYAEEMDITSGAFLGNFPQAFTHLALVSAAVNLDLCQRRGPQAVHGTFADRAHRAVRATIGWKGLLAGFLHSGRARLVSSRASQLHGIGLMKKRAARA